MWLLTILLPTKPSLKRQLKLSGSLTDILLYLKTFPKEIINLGADMFKMKILWEAFRVLKNGKKWMLLEFLKGQG